MTEALTRLRGIATESGLPQCDAKLAEMTARLDHNGVTRFWS